MKFAILSLVLFSSISAQAAYDGLVIFQKPTSKGNGSLGIADYVESSKLDAKEHTVYVTTKSGTVIPVYFYRKLSAVILDAYLKSGYSVNVSACADPDKLLSTETVYDGDCTQHTYTVKFDCGFLEPVSTAYKVNVANYTIRDVSKNPLQTERVSCHPHGYKY